MIYLDYNASTPVDPQVLEAMLPFYRQEFGNPSSVHRAGRLARKAVEEAREKVAALLGAHPREVVFASGGSEANNFAIKGALRANRRHGQHLITSRVEHPSVLDTCRHLERQGAKVTYLPVDRSGLVDPQEVEAAIQPETVLISIQHANNETGTIQPLSAIARRVHARGGLLHTDAVQSVGKIPTQVKELGVDLLTLSGHKLYGPKGIGALYIRTGTHMEALIHGGHQERQRRAGTENVAAIVGLGKACELAGQQLEDEAKQIKGLRERLEAGLGQRIPGLVCHGHPTQRTPGTLNLRLEGIGGQVLLIHLDLAGIAVSTGSACSSGSLDPSHALLAMGLGEEEARGALRFSLGRFTTKAEIDQVLEVLPPLVARLRANPPLRGRGKT